ncbi:MAG: tRNA threonylcarbamoyladenosine dehydratase [Lachnospiraceae bacterium]|nr:tRNA threonylcarbamoyladenosine dehydratase [Lachnospiraceae bacterium]
MKEFYSRTAMLLGEEAIEKLQQSRVAVFGIGGVGGYVVEALVRAGIGAIDIIDNDEVCESNLNRQIIATRATLEMAKTDAMEARIHDINPECKVKKYQCFYLPETAGQFDFKHYSYVVDAIDTVTGKIQLVMQAEEAKVPIISSMGTGNKLNPMQLEVTDIYKTSVCPLAKVMRRELKQRGIKKLKVVYSKEEPRTPIALYKEAVTNEKRRATPGSVSFVPSVAGLIIASEVIKDLTGV